MNVPRRLLHLGLLMIAVSYIYTLYTRNKTKDAFTVEQVILDSWNKVIQSPAVEFRKVIVGINANVDLIVSGLRLMNAVNATPSVAQEHQSINSFQDLLQTFAYFFSRGAASERFTANMEVFNSLVSVAESLRTTEVKFAVGGNAAIMAQRIASSYTKTKVLLVGPVGPRLKALLHPKVSFHNSTTITKEEIHLIMEYKQGEICGDFVSPASSRFITSHDTLSTSAIVIDMFFNTIGHYRPELILLSGLHLLDVQPKDLWMDKLKMIKRNLNQIQKTVPIHLELGSSGDFDYAKNLIYRILPHVDSVGMNEQELTLMAKVGGGPHEDLYPPTGSTIHVHKAVDILYWIMRTFGRDTTKPDSKRSQFRLQRIHFHCLTYHILVTVGPDWSNSAAAIAAGARTAGTSACGGSSAKLMDADAVELRIPDTMIVDKVQDRMYTFNPHSPLYSWMRDNILFILSPVLVCKHPIHTVGLGDEISAIGLLYSQFYKFEH